MARLQSGWGFIKKVIKKRPVLSFIFSLLLLLSLIAASNTIFKPKLEEAKKAPVSKIVDVYRIGSAPKLVLQAQVEKSRVVKIVTQNPGIVQAINFSEGDLVNKGQTLVVLSTNYQGGNALAIARQIAQNQYDSVKNTFDVQKDLISKQKDLANKTDTNSEELRKITTDSINETQSLIDLNDTIISAFNNNLQSYEASNSAGINDQLILQTQQLKSQFQVANNGLRSSLRSTQYSSSEDKPPADMSHLQKDITLKQLDLQEKSLELSKEVARLQLNLAFVNEATMYPGAPYAGRVERIHVRIGQQVNPGTALITFSGSGQNLNLYLKVSREISQSISKLEPSIIHLDHQDLTVYPDFSSTEATEGQLYVVHFYLPESFTDKLTDGGFVSVEVPIGYPDTSLSVPFVPLEGIFQNQTESYLFVIKDGKATSKKVELGDVLGRFVQVKAGLQTGDQVILARNVIAGESVTAK